ncbi:MAG TPA: sigma factor-like helix-turn-helix DNA-binding protein, partial [Gemmataceae bacterium]|nr:sigma factor-like helix-turn-helix DNA-binding protein [Gemmataceae bacterium]
MTEPALWQDLQPLLDQELSRLPEKYRVPIILCNLEGKSIKDAARHLNWPQGTLAGRLARARAMLAKRLARHGQAILGGALAAALAQNVSSACVPNSLVSATVKAASALAAGQAAAQAVISAPRRRSHGRSAEIHVHE